jgi:hypothetical protein
MTRERPQQDPDPQREDVDDAETGDDRDEVDETSEESFPSSDPPPW